MTAPDRFVCPVCGFPGLVEPARAPSGEGSDEYCPSCDFQFGVTDDDRHFTDEAWREAWIKDGMPWRQARYEPPPDDWDPETHLRELLQSGGSTMPSGERQICPVCGFDGLEDAPRSPTGSPSDEICPACGF